MITELNHRTQESRANLQRTKTQDNERLALIADRLHRCGAQVIYEMLRDLSRGRDPGETIEDFGRLLPDRYLAVAAAVSNEEGRA